MLYVILKDLKQHSIVFFLYLVLCVFGPCFPLLIDTYVAHVNLPPIVESQNMFGFSLIYAVVIPLVSGQLLICSEKSKRTMFGLILLPLKWSTVITSKEILGAGMTLIALLIDIVSIILTFRLFRGQWGYAPHFGDLILMFTTLVIVMQAIYYMLIRFREKIAMQIAIIGVLCWRPLWAIFMEHFGRTIKPLGDVFGHYGVMFLLILVILMHLLIVRTFIAYDWSAESLE